MEIVRLERESYAAASDVLARAFLDDPAWVWLIPDAERRARLLPWLFRVGFDVTAADVWATAGAVLGAARWLPPGRAADARRPRRCARSSRRRCASDARPGRSSPTAGRSRRCAPRSPAGAHWYLAGIGVDPSAQRQGIGAALLRARARRQRRGSRLPAVLLTNNEANLSFYDGHGFEVVREGETPENGPHAWAMVKRP